MKKYNLRKRKQISYVNANEESDSDVVSDLSDSDDVFDLDDESDYDVEVFVPAKKKLKVGKNKLAVSPKKKIPVPVQITRRYNLRKRKQVSYTYNKRKDKVEKNINVLPPPPPKKRVSRTNKKLEKKVEDRVEDRVEDNVEDEVEENINVLLPPPKRKRVFRTNKKREKKVEENINVLLPPPKRKKPVIKQKRSRKRKRCNEDELDSLQTEIDYFNEYIPRKKKRFKRSYHEWVSATSIKNHLLNDPFLDWCELHYENTDNGRNPKADKNDIIYNSSSKKSKSRPKPKISKGKDQFDPAVKVLLEKGNKFEEKIVNFLKQEYPDKVRTVANSPGDIWDPEKMRLTEYYMQKGIPIIDQAILHNPLNKTYGVADLLVRSDWINKIFNTRPLDDKYIHLKAPNLKGKYHYVVIDIKWTTLPLRSDGVHVLTSKRFPAYKGQLLVYNIALGLLQGYTPPKAYLLGKGWNYTSCRVEYKGYNSLDRLAEVDYDMIDREYFDKTKKAVDWVREVRLDGDNWACLPKPTRTELYPNMKNEFDAPWHGVKNSVATSLKDLTQLWYCGNKNRKIGHSNEIMSWGDKNCTPTSLGINGKKRAPVLEQIIKINQLDKNNKIKLLPKKLTKNMSNWYNKEAPEFFVDFEIIHDLFYSTKIDIKDTKEMTGILFMIGIGYEKKGKWKFKNYHMKTYSLKEEIKIINKFILLVSKKLELFKKKNKIPEDEIVKPKLYHWGNAEVSQFKRCNSRHGNKWDKWMSSVQWIDMNVVFKEEPIVVKGAMSFGLKDISKNMFRNGLIKCNWKDEGPNAGLGAMMSAIKYYKFIDEYNAVSKKDKIKYGMKIEKYKKEYNDLIDYNEIDCKALWEILVHLRTLPMKTRRDDLSDDELSDDDL